MAYSRWLTSYWYTFWASQAKDVEENRDNALFCICTLVDANLTFTAKELRESRDDCLTKVRMADAAATTAEINELGMYMSEFINDVDEKYPLS